MLLFFWVCVPKLWIEFYLWFEKRTCGTMICEMINLKID